ncbi:glycosyl transferase family 2 [Desulfocucumis palustris]|uniref:Glycosyl transferase family 2 n=1 Tax=Desulfocucumis palustris TaxID=1898651 RepID=A0A2L2XB05_9FIRM|nr:glycosyltransferase family 2 protein [Desulfocucumis palustris]GBF33467.1 glycosyl transferase family 2 [Desulfocucumis palustris]
MCGLTSIIILTYNELYYTRKCIESIRIYTGVPYELVLVDNGSGDGTAEFLSSLQGAKVILNSSNLGFAAGCNQGLAAAAGENILLLNNDTVVTPNWLGNMLGCLDSRNDIGLVGPCSNYVGSGNQVEVSYGSIREMIEFARRFNLPDPSKWRQHSSYWLSGFCLLGKKWLFDLVGPFDQRFKTGSWEDVDYSVRVTAAGYKLFVAGDVFIHHYGNRSFRGNKISLAAVQAENARQFYNKWAKR